MFLYILRSIFPALFIKYFFKKLSGIPREPSMRSRDFKCQTHFFLPLFFFSKGAKFFGCDHLFNTFLFCFSPLRCLGKEASMNDQKFRGDGMRFKCKVGTFIEQE